MGEYSDENCCDVAMKIAVMMLMKMTKTVMTTMMMDGDDDGDGDDDEDGGDYGYEGNSGHNDGDDAYTEDDAADNDDALLARIPAGWIFIDTCEEFTNSLAVWVATARSNDKLRHPLVLVRLLPHLL